MNQNTEYERFTQEIYQQLVDSDVVKATTVQHNVKLIGRSGQKHQIDVYWEYEIAGNMHKVAIECKNYNKSVPLSVVQGFKGVLDDLNGVNGIIVTKKGFQIGAKQYAKEWGISLKELRTPDRGETIIGEIEFNTYCEIRHTLYKLDEEWALQHGMDFSRYKRTLDLMSFSNDNKWSNATHIPLQTLDCFLRDSDGEEITSLEKLEKEIPNYPTEDFPYIFCFDNAYVKIQGDSLVKVLEVKYDYEIVEQKHISKLDAESFVRAILKDAQTGETTLL